MGQEVLLRNWVRASDNGNLVAALDERFKVLDSRTGRIANDESCCQMNDLGTILNHFLGDILDIASGTAAAGRVSDDF